MSEAKGLVNIYRCRDCDHELVTINFAEGTTPMFIRCKKCGGAAVSQMYEVDQDLQPTYGWTLPRNIKRLSREMREYYRNGGLELRYILDNRDVRQLRTGSRYPNTRQGRRLAQREQRKEAA